MGLFTNILGDVRDELIIKPTVKYLRNEAEKKAELTKAQRASDFAMNPSGPLIRDQLQMSSGYAQYGSTRSKPGSVVDYVTLRRFSEQYDIARAVINRRKRQLNGLEWEIIPKEKGVEANTKIASIIREQIDDIGGYKVRFREFLDTMTEDLLVLDALAVYKRPNLGGGLYSLEVIDSSTIQLRVDESGGTPMPPEVAYKQVIRGATVFEFNADEMYYEMMNPRSSSPYGLSPLETLVLTVSTALKSDIFNMHMLTEGNIPEGLFSVPETWNPDQIREFQEVWDSMLAGDTRATSKMKFTPPGTYTPTMKPDDMRYRELQTWLMKKTCMLFDIQPQELGFTETVNLNNGEVQQDIGEHAGLIPLARFFEELFADIIQIDLGFPDYKLKFLGLDNEDDDAIAKTNQTRIFSGQATVDEIRTEQGQEPLGVDYPIIVGGTVTPMDAESVQARADNAAAAATRSSVVPSDGKGDATPSDQTGDGLAGADSSETQQVSTQKGFSGGDMHIELVNELRTYRKYAVARAGKLMRPFVSKVLPKEVVDEINIRLEFAKDKPAVRRVFEDYMKDYQVDFLADVADLKSGLSKILD